ncbi:MAG: hypothetical protein PUG99_04610 [Firmicutes bacterium]|nr:hypothetical protein [Peptoniphilus sp.]MDD7363418.1 hypothetical protein [Bacillota bacterium]
MPKTDGNRQLALGRCERRFEDLADDRAMCEIVSAIVAEMSKKRRQNGKCLVLREVVDV